jgi:hypothetical protein
MKEIKLDKIKVATALALFIDDLDPVSVHTLACAGGEVAEHLTHKAGAKPFSSHALATFPDLEIKDIRRLQRNSGTRSSTRPRAMEKKETTTASSLSGSTTSKTTIPCLSGGPIRAWYFALYPKS